MKTLEFILLIAGLWAGIVGLVVWSLWYVTRPEPKPGKTYNHEEWLEWLDKVNEGIEEGKG